MEPESVGTRFEAPQREELLAMSMATESVGPTNYRGLAISFPEISEVLANDTGAKIDNRIAIRMFLTLRKPAVGRTRYDRLVEPYDNGFYKKSDGKSTPLSFMRVPRYLRILGFRKDVVSVRHDYDYYCGKNSRRHADDEYRLSQIAIGQRKWIANMEYVGLRLFGWFAWLRHRIRQRQSQRNDDPKSMYGTDEYIPDLPDRAGQHYTQWLSVGSALVLILGLATVSAWLAQTFVANHLVGVSASISVVLSVLFITVGVIAGRSIRTMLVPFILLSLLLLVAWQEIKIRSLPVQSVVETSTRLLANVFSAGARSAKSSLDAITSLLPTTSWLYELAPVTLLVASVAYFLWSLLRIVALSPKYSFSRASTPPTSAPNEEATKLDAQSLQRISGLGERFEAELKTQGFHTLNDLARLQGNTDAIDALASNISRSSSTLIKWSQSAALLVRHASSRDPDS